MNWFKYPFLRLIIPFATGIWLAMSPYSLCEVSVSLLAMSAVGLLLILVFLLKLFNKSYNGTIWTVVMNVTFFVTGFLTATISLGRFEQNRVVDKNGNALYIARIKEEITEKTNVCKTELEIMAVRDSLGNLCPAYSHAIAYLEKDSVLHALKYGDVITFEADIETVKPPANPEQFDYQRYLFRKGVTHQVYLAKNSYITLNINNKNCLFSLSYNLRDFLLETMAGLGIEGDEYSVAAAILLGYDDELPPELRQNYVTAGSMHVLCVSGLHVGIIFLVFSTILSFLDKYGAVFKILKFCILLLIMWTYAFIAGLAPSILRATIMISFIVIGKIIKRNGVIINSIAASAFVILAIEPEDLFNIGFQLSYAAVIGIVVLQRPIYNVFYIKNKILDKIWELTSVTLVAQFATAPFTIFYFNQFPLYFWLSNLFMTPLSTVVIIGGMIMLLVSFIPYLNLATAWCVKKMIWVMNLGVSMVEELPFSMMKNLYINELQFLSLIAFFTALCFMARVVNKRPLVLILLSCILLFCVGNIFVKMERVDNDGFTTYNVRKSTAIAFFYDRNAIVVCDSAFRADSSIFDFSLKNDFVRRGVKNIVFVDLEDDFDKDGTFVKRRDLISFGDMLIAIYDGRSSDKSFKINADYAIVIGRGRYSMEKAAENFHDRCRILSSETSAVVVNSS